MPDTYEIGCRSAQLSNFAGYFAEFSQLNAVLRVRAGYAEATSDRPVGVVRASRVLSVPSAATCE